MRRLTLFGFYVLTRMATAKIPKHKMAMPVCVLVLLFPKAIKYKIPKSVAQPAPQTLALGSNYAQILISFWNFSATKLPLS
jgi:hypothetical protein